MKQVLQEGIFRQPNDVACGPTSLHAVYRHFGDRIGLDTVIREVKAINTGGTLAVLLGCHALRRGYKVSLYTYNLQMFDPSWFAHRGVDIRRRLIRQALAKGDSKLHEATRAYLEYLDLGGQIVFDDLRPELLQGYLDRGLPILVGLSATHLYRSPRERRWDDEHDDIRGEASGHFVVLGGYDESKREILVADPLHPPEEGGVGLYTVDVHRLINAILLGVLTYDGNLLVLEPGGGGGSRRAEDPAAAASRPAPERSTTVRRASARTPPAGTTRNGTPHAGTAHTGAARNRQTERVSAARASEREAVRRRKREGRTAAAGQAQG